MPISLASRMQLDLLACTANPVDALQGLLSLGPQLIIIDRHKKETPVSSLQSPASKATFPPSHAIEIPQA